MEFVNRQNSQRRHSHTLLAFNAFNCSAKRLASHLAEFLPSTVGRSLEFVAVKKFGKKLGTENHNIKWIAR